MAGTDQVYAKSSRHPHILAVSDKYRAVVMMSAEHFRQRAPFVFGLGVVDSVTVRTSSAERVLAVGPGPAEEGKELRRLLGGLIQVRAEDFDEATPDRLSRWGLDPPRGSLIWVGGGDTLAVLDVGRADKGLRALRVSGGTEVRGAEILLVPEAQTGPLWDALRDPGTR
jgi:hypothetical protein